MIQFYYIEKG